MAEVTAESAQRAAALLEVDQHTAEKARLAEVQALGEKIIEQLKTVYDPEIPTNIYDMGLIYRIDVEDDNTVRIEMTLTSPHCPVAETLPPEVERKVETVEGVKACEVQVVWDPPWNPSMMTEEAQLELGMIY
jgi:FeS assembly SUF system protein